MYTSVLGGEWMLSNISLYLLARLMGWEEQGKQNCTSNATQAEQKFWNYDPLGKKRLEMIPLVRSGRFSWRCFLWNDCICNAGRAEVLELWSPRWETGVFSEGIFCKMIAFATPTRCSCSGRLPLAYPEILFGGSQIEQGVNFMNYICIIIYVYMLASICQIRQFLNCLKILANL